MYSIELIGFGLTCDKIDKNSFSVIKFFHSNGVPYIVTFSLVSSLNGSFSAPGILYSSIYSISLSGLAVFNISIWSIT